MEHQGSPKLGGSYYEQPSLIALPLAALLAIPALAQTTSSSTDQSQPAAQSTSTDSSMNATGKAPLAPPSREGFWGRVNPFARKKYVQRQTEPIRDRVNELDELTSTNGKSIKDTDSRAQAGIKMASDKADVADQHAVDAGNKATMAQQIGAAGHHPRSERRDGGQQHRPVQGFEPD